MTKAIPGVSDTGHFNAMPHPWARISTSAFMEELLCPASTPDKHEIRQTHIGTCLHSGACRVHIWWFHSHALAAAIIPRKFGISNADLKTEDWDFRFYYVGCHHRWQTDEDQEVHQLKRTCSECGAKEDWDSS